MDAAMQAGTYRPTGGVTFHVQKITTKTTDDKGLVLCDYIRVSQPVIDATVLIYSQKMSIKKCGYAG